MNPFTFEVEEQPDVEAQDFEAQDFEGQDLEALDLEAPEADDEGGDAPALSEVAEREGTEEEVQYSIVISPTSPGDGRVRIASIANSNLSTRRFPFNSVCLVEVWRNGRFTPWGSGSLIAPQVVLTAGHVLRDNGGLEAKVRVTPGADFGAGTAANRSQGSPVQQETVRARLRVHSSLDYGVIILPRPFGRPGQFPLLQGSRGFNPRDFLNVAGFPGDKPGGTMWFHAEPVVPLGASATHLRYTMDTCPGHSGSPVWVKLASGQRIQVGVHTTGSGTGGQKGRCNPPQPVPGQNSGVRITCAVIRQINAWCDGLRVRRPGVVGAC